MAFRRKEFIKDAREAGFTNEEINNALADEGYDLLAASEKGGNFMSGAVNRLPIIMGTLGGAATGIPTGMAGAPIGAAAGAGVGYALRDLLAPYAAQKPAGDTPGARGKYLVDPQKFGTPTGTDWATEQQRKGGEKAVGEGLMSAATAGTIASALSALYALSRPGVMKKEIADFATRRAGKAGKASQQEVQDLLENIKGIQGKSRIQPQISKQAFKAATQMQSRWGQGNVPYQDILAERRLYSRDYSPTGSTAGQVVDRQAQQLLSDYLKQSVPSLKIADPAYNLASKYQQHQSKILGGTGGAILASYLIRKMLNRLGGRENY